MESLGLDIRLLLAQIVNFSILLFVLNRLLYKPIRKILSERNKKIADTLKQSEQIEVRLKKIAEQEEKVLETARKSADEEKSKLIKLAKEEGEEIVSNAKMASEKEVQKGIVRIKMFEEEMRQTLKKQFLEEVVGEVTTKLSKKAVSSKYPMMKEVLKEK